MCSLLDRPFRRSPAPHTKFRSFCNSWTCLTPGPRGVTGTPTCSTSSPWQQPSVFSSSWIWHRCNSRRLSVRSLTCSPPSPNFSSGINPTPLQRCTQRGQFSRSRARSFKCWRPWCTTLPLQRLLSGFKSSDVVYLSGKNNSSYCPQHPDLPAAPPTVLIASNSCSEPPLQHKCPWPKSERPPGSCPPSSGSA